MRARALLSTLALGGSALVHSFRTPSSAPRTVLSPLQPTGACRPTSSPSATTFLQQSANNGGDAPSSDPQLSRRQLAELSVAAVGLTASYLGTRENTPQEYGLWGILPVGPYKRKKTVTATIVPGQIWTFDQKFGILNVQVPLRMTVVKLDGGGLFVYDPIAATPELLGYLRALERDHGPVKHIVLGSVAIEHKVYAGVFAQKCPAAQVWVQEGQYSFPQNLPVPFLGFPSGRTQVIPQTPAEAPADWRDFEFRTLGPLISKDGAFGETVFFHKPTRTLLVTDTVLEVTEEVPRIFEDDDHRPLLYHARDTVTEVVEDTREVRERGWRRIVLFGLFFTPAAIRIKDTNTAFAERRPDINSDFAGIYPWDWVDNDMPSFKALQGGLLVAPILQQLILNRAPIEVLDFADAVARWPIQRIIPAHLKNDLKYTGKDYRAAFSFLEAKGVPRGLPKPLAADMQLLVESEVGLLESGAVAKCPPLPGGETSRAEILQQTVYGCRGDVCAPRSSA